MLDSQIVESVGDWFEVAGLVARCGWVYTKM